MDIVIYEQDYLTRALLQEWLSHAGYRVRAGNTSEQEPNRRAALAIVDLYMPKQTGSQCVREIRAAHPNTPIIAISAQFRSGLRAAGPVARDLGVQQVIAKPLVRTDLLDAVRGMIGLPE